MLGRFAVAFSLALFAATPSITSSQASPTTDQALEPLLQKMATYIATYGQKASMFVGIEKYTQSVSLPDVPPTRPRRLVAEFAIVKAPDGTGWIGFRDVVEYDGQKVSDRRDRLVTILTDTESDSAQVTKLANESARFNIGPISRNFNTPTSTLFFFYPANLSRFVFTRKGVRKIDGIETVEIAFKESKSPTLVRTQRGVDVPSEGLLWVVPADGTVVRSRLVLRNFADYVAPTRVQGDAMGTPVTTATARGGEVVTWIPNTGPAIDVQRSDTMADIDVTYSHHGAFGVWLPTRMTEMYAGPIVAQKAKPPVAGTATTRATYSEFRQFGTDVKINVPK